MKLLILLSADPAGAPEDGENARDKPSYEEKLRVVTRVYNRRKLGLALAHIALAAAYLVVMLLLVTKPLANHVDLLVERYLGGSRAANVALYTFFFFLLYRIVSFPLHYQSDYCLEHEFMLSTETFPQWLWREAKTFLLSQVMLILLVLVFYAFLRFTGDWWWLCAAGAYILSAVIIGKIFPVVILPLFFKRSPLSNPALVKRLVDLARNARFNVSDVYSFDLSRQTKKINAAMIGLGKTRQIILSDTLLASFSPEEIEAVFAHEIGHHVHNHFLRLFVFGAILSVVSFYIAHVVLKAAVEPLGLVDPGNIATLPLFVLILAAFAFVMRPITNAYSRRLEAESDRYAVNTRGCAMPFARALEKLSRTNLADRRPGRLVEIFFYDHPPLDKRIARAIRQEKKMNSPQNESPQ